MEIRGNNMFLTKEEENATNYSSPVDVMSFEPTSVGQVMNKRSARIADIEALVDLPEGHESPMLTFNREMLERQNQIAKRVVEQFALYMGLTDPSDPAQDLRKAD